MVQHIRTCEPYLNSHVPIHVLPLFSAWSYNGKISLLPSAQCNSSITDKSAKKESWVWIIYTRIYVFAHKLYIILFFLKEAENIVQQISYSSSLNWKNVASNSCCNYGAPMVWSSDSLRHLTVTCIVSTERYRAYVVQHFRLLSLLSLLWKK
jgi:hypothetical protein